MLRNIIGPLFNFNLAHFLTLEFCQFFCFFFCFFFWAETPIFIVFSAKHAKLKETQKRNKDTICEHNCANSFCQNVLFLCIFHFCCFFQFPFFSEMFFDRFPKIKKQQNSKARRTKKQQQPENKMQSKKT